MLNNVFVNTAATALFSTLAYQMLPPNVACVSVEKLPCWGEATYRHLVRTVCMSLVCAMP